MNSTHSRFFKFLVCFLLVTAVMAWRYHSSSQQKSPTTTASLGPKKNISVLASLSGNQPKNINSAPQATSKVAHLIPRQPSPLHEPSAQELQDFPGATVVEAAEIPGPEPDQKTSIRLLKTNFKYPLIRTEEIINADQNSVVARTEMVADHFLVTLPAGEDPSLFLRHFGATATSIAQVTPDAPLYRVNLASPSLEALPAALAQTETMIPGTGEPDFIAHALTKQKQETLSMTGLQWAFSLTGLQWALNPQWSDPSARLFGVEGCDVWDVWAMPLDQNGRDMTDASSVIVAILDSGIRYTHDDIKVNMWHNPSPTVGDIYGCDSYHVLPSNLKKELPFTGNPMDGRGHGTSCAAIVGGNKKNGLGSGVAQKVQLMACRFMSDQGAGAESDEIIGIYYAIQHGAQFINCSFAGVRPSGTGLLTQGAEYDAIAAAGKAGVVLICAAGNDGLDNDNPITSSYPASYPLDNIVSVAALSEFDELVSSYWDSNWDSNYGTTTVHLAAPGDCIISAWGGDPNNPGLFSPVGSGDSFGSGDSCYAFVSGTSAAAPFVTGTFALLRARFPLESYQSLKARILDNVVKRPSLDGKTISGGTLDVYQALNSEKPNLGIKIHGLP